jgi:hypothetical protein
MRSPFATGCCDSERLPAAMTAFMEGTDSSTNNPEIPETLFRGCMRRRTDRFQAGTAWLLASMADAPPAEFAPAAFDPLIRSSSGIASGAGGNAGTDGD